VEPVPFDIERDMVTPTMKKKRQQMLKYYQVLNFGFYWVDCCVKHTLVYI
jgi:hypothetical protein